MDNMKDLHELADKISMEINRINKKIGNSSERFANSDIDYIDKLTHTLKSLKTTIAMEESADDYYERAMESSARRGEAFAFASKLESMMDEAPDEQYRKDIEKLVMKIKG